MEANITAAVRDSARTVTTNLKLVEATRKAAELAQQRLEAEQKRFNVGLGTQLELLQAQRDLSNANQQELQAMIQYNLALVNFDAIQTVPVNGR
jgi:outer membrane protein TolC